MQGSLSRYEVVLEVTVSSASNLKNVNWRNGALRPYAVLWVDGGGGTGTGTLVLKRPSGRPQGRLDVQVCVRERKPRYGGYDYPYPAPGAAAGVVPVVPYYGEQAGAPAAYGQPTSYAAPPAGYPLPLPRRAAARWGWGRAAVGAAAAAVGASTTRSRRTCSGARTTETETKTKTTTSS